MADTLDNTQREFHALELGGSSSVGGFEPARFDLSAAEEDGTLARLGSTYSPENDVVYDGVSRPGVRLVTFAPILKHGLFPLAEMLDALLGVATAGDRRARRDRVRRRPADRRRRGRPSSDFLQLRPLAASARAVRRLRSRTVDRRALICRERAACSATDGSTTCAIWWSWTRSGSTAAAAATSSRDVARFNAELAAERAPYVLIGVGRWGSADPFLGIPVTWDQIAGARAIVEAGFRDLRVTPSQGSHFFQNLVAGNVGYFTVNPDVGRRLRRLDVAGGAAGGGRGRVRAPSAVRRAGRRGR